MSKSDYTDAPGQPAEHEISRRDSNLRFISSPVATGLSEKAGSGHDRLEATGLESQIQADVERLGHRYNDNYDCPEFIKHSNSTNYEVRCVLTGESTCAVADACGSYSMICGSSRIWKCSHL